MDHDKIRMKLSAYKDGEIETNLTALIRLHLQSCDACREELEELNQIDRLILGLPEFSASETFVSEVAARAQTGKPRLHWTSNVLKRIEEAVFLLADSILALFPGYKPQNTDSLDEFGDFPPLLLSYSYFRLIGQKK